MKRDSLEIHHILLGLFFVGIILYGLFEARVLLGVFKIHIDSPLDGEAFTDPLIEVVGEVKHAESILINGRQIPVNRDNTFSESYLLLPGYNEITVTAQNKFGREEAVTLHLYLSNKADSL